MCRVAESIIPPTEEGLNPKLYLKSNYLNPLIFNLSSRKTVYDMRYSETLPHFFFNDAEMRVICAFGKLRIKVFVERYISRCYAVVTIHERNKTP